MKLLVISYERLISNGSAGTTVMCGLVEAALNKGWEVTYVALTLTKIPMDWESPFQFTCGASRLRQMNVLYSRLVAGALRRFIGSFNHAWVSRVHEDEALSVLKESYDGVIGFDSLAIDLARSVNAQRKVIILGDPAGRRLWHSTPWSRPQNKIKAVLLDIAESVFYRSLPQEFTIAMFGSGHARCWSRILFRKIIDIRPFIPAREVFFEAKAGKKPIIYFGGTLAGTASRQAFNMIFSGILPAFRSRFGRDGFQVRIVGDCPEYFIKAAANYGEISILGRVASFEKELSLGDVFILAMNYPVGVRARVCSALAAGNICLVHPTALYNMPELSQCPAVKIVSTPYQYAKAIADLPSGRELLCLRRKAMEFFNDHYVARVAAEKLLGIIAGNLCV